MRRIRVPVDMRDGVVKARGSGTVFFAPRHCQRMKQKNTERVRTRHPRLLPKLIRWQLSKRERDSFLTTAVWLCLDYGVLGTYQWTHTNFRTYYYRTAD